MSGYYSFNEKCNYKFGLSGSILNVVDVYDIASGIGKDFEILIDRFGPDAVTNLMPKVINVLEELEEYVLRYETENQEIGSLQAAIERLESEKVARVQDRSRYEKELEEIELTWSSESGELMKLVDRLQDENRRLEIELREKSNDEVVATMVKEESIADEVQLITRMKVTVDKQRKEFRQVKKELLQKTADLEALQQQCDHQIRQNAEIRRRNCVSKKQSDNLLEEKSDLEVQLQTKDQVILQMRSFVHSDSSDSSVTGAGFSPPMSPMGFVDEHFVERLNAEGKMIVDNKDPHRPRFTVQELKEVILDRNQLKAKLVEVEEELKIFKNAGDEEAPVQGPINKEPDEKFRPRFTPDGDLGIKQFFERLIERLN